MHAEEMAMRRRISDNGTDIAMQAENGIGIDGALDEEKSQWTSQKPEITETVDCLRRDVLAQCQELNLKLDQVTSRLDTRLAKRLDEFQEKMLDVLGLHEKAYLYLRNLRNGPGLRYIAQEDPSLVHSYIAQEDPSLFHSIEKEPSQQIMPKECDMDLSLRQVEMGSHQAHVSESMEESHGILAEVEACGQCGASNVPNHISCWKCGTRLHEVTEAGCEDPISSQHSRGPNIVELKGLQRSESKTSSFHTENSSESRKHGRRQSVGSIASFRSLVGGASIANQLQEALNVHTRNRGRFAQAAWLYLEDPQLVFGGVALGRMMFVLVFASCCLTIVQTLEAPPLGRFSEAVLEWLFDGLLSVEIIVRFMVCPNRFYFWTQGHNLLDLLNGPLILIARATLQFAFPDNAGPRSTPSTLLNSSLPVLRLLRLLRRFDGAHLIYRSFQLTSEALPELLYVLAVIITTFASILYAVEPRSNIASLPEAWWFTVVTLGTVGYGDVTPVTPEGKVVVCVLILVAALYMAMPIGTVGKIFAEVWDDRNKILATQLARRRFKAMGYTSKDIPSMFFYFDYDKDGKLSVTEFTEMMRQMQFDISGQRASQLFHIFDADGGGYIEDQEFMEALFPESMTEIYSSHCEGNASEPDPQLSTSSKNCPRPLLVGQTGATSLHL